MRKSANNSNRYIRRLERSVFSYRNGWVCCPASPGDLCAAVVEVDVVDHREHRRAGVPDIDDPAIDTYDGWPHDDPRWPTRCQHGCGYRFRKTDMWRVEDRPLVVLRSLRGLRAGSEAP